MKGLYVNTLLRVEGNVVMVRAMEQPQGGETQMITRAWDAPFEAQGKASLRPYMSVLVDLVWVVLHLNPAISIAGTGWRRSTR
jgi:hypothetical protein